MAAILTGSTVGGGAEWRPAVIVHTSGGMLRFEREYTFATEDLAVDHANGDAAHVDRMLKSALAALGYRLSER